MNTRTNPTANARSLHLGHLYLILVNQAEADRLGGKHIIRWDDAQAYWLKRFGPCKIEQFKHSMKADLDWLGIRAEYTSESDSGVMGHPDVMEHTPPDFGESGVYETAEVLTEPRPYPYVPWLTAAKVIMDYEDEIGILIRAEDLVTEDALYVHFCKEFGYPIPRRVYLPKLREVTNSTYYSMTSDLASVSKTDGNFSLCDLRKHYTQDEILDKLAEACLKDVRKSWFIENVKPNPHLFASDWRI